MEETFSLRLRSSMQKNRSPSQNKTLTTAPATRAGRATAAERRPATAVGRTAAMREARAKAILWIRGVGRKERKRRKVD